MAKLPSEALARGSGRSRSQSSSCSGRARESRSPRLGGSISVHIPVYYYCTDDGEYIIIGLMCQFSISYTVVTHVVSDDHDASCSNTRLPDTICAPPVLHSTKRLHTHHAITVSKINATHHNYFPVIRFAMFAYYDHQALVNLSTHLLASNTSGAPVTAHTSAGSSRSYTFIHSTLWLTLGIT